MTEGNAGTKNMVFTATLSAAVAQAVTVTYTTSAGTATAASDYTQATGTITFAANTTTKTFNVVIVGNAVAEGNETFNVVLSNPVGTRSTRDKLSAPLSTMMPPEILRRRRT